MGSNVEAAMNPWEVQALNYHFSDNRLSSVAIKQNSLATTTPQTMKDPVFFPGLYSATGFDVMAILFCLMVRKNPQINLGPVDCSVALILCDLDLPDEPIVYVTDAFCDLTGYSKPEIVGRNCRFLQTPNPGSKAMPSPYCKAAPTQMRDAIKDRKEVQLRVVNYRKDGQRFYNMVTIIPVDLDDSGHRYAVGFSVEVQ